MHCYSQNNKAAGQAGTMGAPAKAGLGTDDQKRAAGKCRLWNGGVRYLRQSRRLERLEPLKAVGLVTPVLNADLRGQKPTLAEQIGVCRLFYQRFSAFQNTELSNSLSRPAEPGVYQCNYRLTITGGLSVRATHLMSKKRSPSSPPYPFSANFPDS